MQYDMMDLTAWREVTLCGTNIYPVPTYHVERTMDEHDLMYIYDGEWEVAQDGVTYSLKSGDMMLLRAGSHHHGVTPCTVNMRNMFVHFNAASSDRGGVSLSAAEARSYAGKNVVCVPTVVHCGMSSEVSGLMREIIGIYWSHRDDRARKAALLLKTLLNELAYISRNTLAQSDEWITVLLQAMHMEPARFLSLEEAAEIVHMSVRTLSTRFRRAMGRGVHEYQVSVKLEMAYNALRSGHYTVREAAVNHGFSDPFYFSRIFKQAFGVPPSEVRRGEPSANINRPEMR